MSAVSRLTPNLSKAWGKRFTIRTRLTVAFTALVGIAGAAIVAIVAVFMYTVPSYVAVSTIPGAEPAKPAPLIATRQSPVEGDQPETFTTTGIVLRDPAEIINTSLAVSLIVLVVLVAAGAVAAWAISGKMLRPLQAINHAAVLASTGSLDHRVGLQGPRDELHDLSDTFDMMLGRLDSAFQSHRRFAANASHELRTPLAATETMLEVALSDPDLDVRELRDVATKVLETNRRNSETVDALLALTEVEYRPRKTEPVRLDRLVREVLAVTASEADAMDLDVTVAMRGTVVSGDDALLRQAVSNLITNAIWHNEPNGILEIALTSSTDSALLRIENTGASLTAERIAQLREPFARGSGRVRSDRHGHGLGLAIAATAVETHGGDLRLTPRYGGGLVALIALPLHPSTQQTVI